MARKAKCSGTGLRGSLSEGRVWRVEQLNGRFWRRGCRDGQAVVWLLLEG